MVIAEISVPYNFSNNNEVPRFEKDRLKSQKFIKFERLRYESDQSDKR